MTALLVESIRFEDLGTVGVEHDEQRLAPDADEVLLAPSWLGICGSDLHVLHGRHPFVRPPVITGHEVAGTVLAGARPAGQRVLVDPLVACGQCAACADGAVNTCEHAKVCGFGIPGLARTRALVSTRQLHPIPDAIPDGLAALAEPLATAVHAVKRAANPRGLGEVLVLGGGSIGLAMVLALRAAEAETVTVVEPIAAKRSLAERIGADRVYESAETVTERSYTAVLDCVGSPHTIATATWATVAGGRVVVVGVGAVESTPTLPMARMQRFEVDLVGSGMYLPDDIDAALALLDSRLAACRALVSARYELAQAAEAFAAASRSETVKVMVRLGT